MNRIFAVIGMCGSGKSEVVKFFVEKGFKKVYFGDVVINELKNRNLEINENNEKTVREDLRDKFGMGVTALKSLETIKQYVNSGFDVVIESLYSWDEFKIIKNEFGSIFKLVNVYTTKKLRYERLSKRKIRPLTAEEAVSRDISEIENLDKGGPIAFADYQIINDSGIENTKKQVEVIIEKN